MTKSTVRDLYTKAATTTIGNLCCNPKRRLFEGSVVFPDDMLKSDYGCGTTVHPQDFTPGMKVLYVGVGGGMEALAFAYLTRAPHSVLAVDAVEEMLERARTNLRHAEKLNPWFRREFVNLLHSEARSLLVPDDSVDVVAQNCLFNIFHEDELKAALAEARRVLRPKGKLTMSDPVSPVPLPAHVQENETLRAWCLAGALTLEEYLRHITEAGFGTIEVRARKPFRVLDAERYRLAENIVLDQVEVVAYNEPAPADGPCIFTGRCAIYFGEKEFLDDGKGHRIQRDIPLPVCDKTAKNLAKLELKDIIVTESTWHYTDGNGCC